MNTAAILRALDLPEDSLEALAPCHDCDGTNGVDVDLSIRRGRWYVWCGCGLASDEHGELAAAVADWNERQAEREGEARAV